MGKFDFVDNYFWVIIEKRETGAAGFIFCIVKAEQAGAIAVRIFERTKFCSTPMLSNEKDETALQFLSGWLKTTTPPTAAAAAAAAERERASLPTSIYDLSKDDHLADSKWKKPIINNKPRVTFLIRHVTIHKSTNFPSELYHLLASTND
ncbi:hypothetical protein T4B_2384 [Trichinella pseudospiralis]|uniref:Uncharacterized protein n=1 Tax=Trichinella pseudospiralis TaxID=6337 RepID=A0A0V1IU95_TRIPS|nr:hypothetical protein T4B_2384 [Trichinella pseudospiralis]